MPMAPAELVQRFYFEVWNGADEAVAREILHPGFTFRASLGPQMQGPERFIAYMRAIHAALADYKCAIEEIVEQGGRAAARMRFGGLHRGALFGVAPTGRIVEWSGAAFFATDGERIVSLWVLGDVDALKRQLGAASGAAMTG